MNVIELRNAQGASIGRILPCATWSPHYFAARSYVGLVFAVHTSVAIVVAVGVSGKHESHHEHTGEPATPGSNGELRVDAANALIYAAGDGRGN